MTRLTPEQIDEMERLLDTAEELGGYPADNEIDGPIGRDFIKMRYLFRRCLRENADLQAQTKEVVRLANQYAREAGEAKGRLEMSEAAGIVDGWRERADAAEGALAASQAREARMREALPRIIRSVSVECVDGGYGFTYEYNSSSAQHKYEYDAVEYMLTKAFERELAALSEPPVSSEGGEL